MKKTGDPLDKQPAESLRDRSRVSTFLLGPVDVSAKSRDRESHTDKVETRHDDEALKKGTRRPCRLIRPDVAGNHPSC